MSVNSYSSCEEGRVYIALENRIWGLQHWTREIMPLLDMKETKDIESPLC